MIELRVLSGVLQRAYPVVAGDEEVIGSLRAVPERVLASEAVDIFCDESGEREHGVRVGHVEMGHHVLDAVGQEEHVRLRRVVRDMRACPFHALDELPL